MGSTSLLSTSSRSRTLALGTAAVVAVGLVGAYGPITGAQTAVEPIGLEIVSRGATGAIQEVPVTGTAAISDTGGVIAYEAIVAPVGPVPPGDPDGAGDLLSTDRRVWIRDGPGTPSRPVAEPGTVAPGISGDGCLIAYSVVGPDDATATLTVVDRCAVTADRPLPLGTVIETVTLESATTDPAAPDLAQADTPEPPLEPVPPSPIVRVAPPALSFDGTTIVWSTGREIRRYERVATDEPYVRSHTFDAVADASPDIVTGAAVDVSADGDSIVFLAGPGPTPFAPTPANVYLWTPSTPPAGPELLSTTASGEASTFDAASPTISADGGFVVFESTGIDLAVVGDATVAAPFVVGVDRTDGSAQILVDDATRPALSGDGYAVAYQRGDAIRLLASGVDSVADLELGELVAARPVGPITISQHARWLVFASAEDLTGGSSTPADAVRPTVLWAADRAASNPDSADTTTTTTSSTTTTTSSTTTTTTSPPTGSPTTSAPTTPTTVARPSPTTPPPVTTSPNVPVTTRALAPIRVRFRPPTSPFPRVPFPTAPTRPPTSTSPGTSTTSTSTSTGTSTTSTEAPDGVVSASTVSFAPTVIVTGRSVEPLTLTNRTADTVGVTAVSLTPTGVFSIMTDACSNTALAPGASCAVEVRFAPVDIGPTSGTATLQLDDGSTVTATLDGEGVSEPTLDLVPTVARASQTVTVFGAGFPPDSTVELTQPGAASPQAVVVEADGTFAHVVVLLPNTPIGPVTLSVAGQTDAFADVEVELLVSRRGTSAGGAALRSSSLAS